MGTLSFDKASYAKGDTVHLTVKDASRIVTDTINVPSVAGPLTANIQITAPAAQPTDSGGHTWTLVSDDPTTGTTVWSTLA